MQKLNPDEQKQLRRGQVIADQLTNEILQGIFVAGQRFLSRNDICSRFGVSPVTAARIQRRLLKKGLLTPAAGHRFHVADPATCLPPLRTVRFLRQPPCHDDWQYQDEWDKALAAECQARGLEYRRELFLLPEQKRDKITISCNWHPGEGLIFSVGPDMARRQAGMLLRTGIPRVTLKDTFPGITRVGMDNSDGLRQLIQLALKRGCQRLLFLDNPFKTTRSERQDRVLVAPLVAELVKVKLPVHSCTGEEEICELFRKYRPDGVILSSTSLLPEIQNVLKEIRKRPLMMAFHEPCGVSLDLTDVVCYIDDYAAVAKKLVDCLTVPLPEYHPDFLRVPGKLKLPTR